MVLIPGAFGEFLERLIAEIEGRDGKSGSQVNGYGAANHACA